MTKRSAIQIVNSFVGRGVTVEHIRIQDSNVQGEWYFSNCRIQDSIVVNSSAFIPQIQRSDIKGCQFTAKRVKENVSIADCTIENCTVQITGGRMYGCILQNSHIDLAKTNFFHNSVIENCVTLPSRLGFVHMWMDVP